MKIIFSPSKGMNYQNIKISNTNLSPIFFNKTNLLINNLQDLDLENLSKKLKIKGSLLEKTYENYQKFFELPEYPSIFLYNGVSFKNLELDEYTYKEFDYMVEHLRIFSALYGILCPNTLIREYRLDMTSKITDESSYNFWKKEINEYFSKDETIINLASNEFSKILDRKLHTILDIEFYQLKESGLTTSSTESKKMRGKFLNYMIKNQISQLELLKEFSQENYTFSEELSSAHKFIFIAK